MNTLTTIYKHLNFLIDTISLFHKSKNEQSLADYLYRRILNIHA